MLVKMNLFVGKMRSLVMKLLRKNVTFKAAFKTK